MNANFFKSLKVKITLLFSLVIAIVFAINWQVAVRTMHGEKIADLEKVLTHLLVESKDEYIIAPLSTSSDLGFLHTIPHNILILKDSDANRIRFLVSRAPRVLENAEVGASIALDNGLYLNVTSDQEKIDEAVAKYGAKLFERYGLTLCLILIVSFVLLQRYMRPLGILAERAHSWKCGDPFKFALENAGQEIEELSHAFSALVYRLEGFRTKEKALFKEMAHELKTPIAIMRARLDVYEKSDNLSKEQMVTELGHDIERLMSELKNVLFFESTDFEDSTYFEMTDVLDEVIHKVDILARRRKLKLFVCQERLGVNAPRKLFQKVMTALVENALTYAKEGSEIKINIETDKQVVTISNIKGEEKYLFSSKIGQKMLDRVSKELGIGYAIMEDASQYRIDVFMKPSNGTS